MLGRLPEIFGSRKLACLSLASWLASLGAGLYAPLYAAFVEKVGGDLIDAGYAWSAFAFASAFVTYIAGDMAERYSRKSIVAFGFFLASIGIMLFFFATSPLYIAAGEILIGVGWAVTNPAWDAIFSLHLNRERPGKTWSYYYMGTYIAQGLGSVVSGIFATLFGFRALFLLASFLSFLGGLAILLGL